MTAYQHAMRSFRRKVARGVFRGAVIVGGLEATTHLPSQGRSSEAYHAVSDKIGVPLMRWTLNPEQAHHVAIRALSDYPGLVPRYRPSAREQSLTVEQTLWGDEEGRVNPVRFPNPIGLAAGFDKDAEGMRPLLKLGFGFVEIGSVTLKPQPGNPSPRMFRLTRDSAIVNRYGFNSQGCEAVKDRLVGFRQSQEAASAQGLIGVNLGKNKTSSTPLEDYQELIAELGPSADYLVINVSSPNTPGLRDLQATDSLEYLLDGCLRARNELPGKHRPPLLVKLSPDLSDGELEDIAGVLMKLGVDGIIVTNTTTARPYGLQSPSRNETGGLSGKPLNQRSTECIRLLFAATKGTIPIMGVGGIFTAHDVYEKMKAGASLVQIYSSLVYEGPGLVSRLRHDLAEILKDNGHRNVEEVIGSDHEELYWERRQRLQQAKFRRIRTRRTAQKKEELHARSEPGFLFRETGFLFAGLAPMVTATTPIQKDSKEESSSR